MDRDDIEMIRDAADRLLADHCGRGVAAAAEVGTWPMDLWNAVAAAGLPHAAVSEARGGAGVPIADALLLAGIAAEHAAPVPLGETIVAAWLMDRAGLVPPDGPLTFVALHGAEARRVPWGRSARCLLIGERDGRPAMVLAEPEHVDPQLNMAGEPRDTLAFPDDVFADAMPSPVTVADLHAIGAALRSVQIAGALRRAVRLATDYAQQRVQFGRALSQFQAIQQNLAVLATQASVATAAAEMAARAVGEDRLLPGIAVAKARCGEAAGVGSAIAHQIHGAIGFTLEHDLQLVTRRLLSWRDEFGNEADWNALFGRQLARAGGDALWRRITEV